MSRDIMYNQKVKEDFLSNYPEDTQTTYRRIFIKSKSAEEVIEKDLYDFNIHEIEEVLYDLNPLTPSISQTNGRIISSYIIWWNSKENRTDINPLKRVGAEWFDKFVDKNKKLYFSYSEIKEIEDFCENAQDAVILRSYFENVSGKDSIEIRNMTIDDLIEDEKCILLRDNSGNVVKKREISDEFISLIKQAHRQETYLKRNGLMAETDNVRPYTDLVQNKFIVRNSITRTDTLNESHGVHSSVIYRRMNVLSELLNLPYLTGKNVLRSGIIYYGWQLLQEYGFLEKEQYEMIARKFEIKNWYSLKEYCNYETIHKLYSENAATISA